MGITKEHQATIEALLSKEDYSTAISILSESNREKPESDKERLLASLRAEGFEAMASNAVSDSWPPSYDDPFENNPGIPEIEGGELDGNNLAAGILSHGSLIVRNLLSNFQTASLTRDIDRMTSAQEAFHKGASLEETAPWFAPPEAIKGILHSNRKFTRITGGACAADSPRVMFRLFELYHQLGLRQLLAEYFGESPCIAGTKWVLRKMAPLPEEVDWHQDGAFMGKNVRSLNVWIALSHCGGQHDNAGLELIPGRLNRIVPTGTDGAKLQWTVSPAYVDREFASTPPVCPAFSPGDAILFDHFNLHRTSYSPTMKHHRYAIESWFFAPSKYWEKQAPLLF